MIILGIDPGTTSVGYALVKGTEPPKLLECGTLCIRSKNNLTRLEELHNSLSLIFKKWKPEAAAIERLFFSKNAKTAISVSEARGAILLTTALAKPRVYEYTPLEIKKIVTGDGRADKTQLKKMVQLIFKETASLKEPDDVFDAIATALACHYEHRIGRLMRSGSNS